MTFLSKNPKENIFLAPLAGYTDRSFREICRSYGARMSTTEMVSAKGISYDNKKTYDLLNLGEEETPSGIQLFGRDSRIIADTAARLEQQLGEKIAFFDINMGCPAPKIVNNGEGSALMKEPAVAAEIVGTLKRSVSVPVSVKFRKGFARGEETAAAFAKVLEEAGADLLFVHGRTREQYYEGKADREAIRCVKEAVTVPVIANGDIYSPSDAEAMLRETGADGVLVARGALGNPMLFRDILDYFTAGSVRPADFREKAAAALLQAEKTCAYKGEFVGIREMRKHGAWYVKGLEGAARYREKLVRMETLSEFKDILNEILQNAEK